MNVTDLNKMSNDELKNEIVELQDALNIVINKKNEAIRGWKDTQEMATFLMNELKRERCTCEGES